MCHEQVAVQGHHAQTQVSATGDNELGVFHNGKDSNLSDTIFLISIICASRNQNVPQILLKMRDVSDIAKVLLL